jgi:hypothetical protein
MYLVLEGIVPNMFNILPRFDNTFIFSKTLIIYLLPKDSSIPT